MVYLRPFIEGTPIITFRLIVVHYTGAVMVDVMNRSLPLARLRLFAVLLPHAGGVRIGKDKEQRSTINLERGFK